MIDEGHTLQDRYYISSVQADAAYFNQAIRTHWGIENQLLAIGVGFAGITISTGTVRLLKT